MKLVARNIPQNYTIYEVYSMSLKNQWFVPSGLGESHGDMSVTKHTLGQFYPSA